MLPPLESGQYLVNYLFKIGPIKGEEAIDGQELVAWEHLLGIEWKPYQAELLVRMSRAYLGEMHRASKHDAQPPWGAFEKPWKWVQQQKGERRLSTFLR